MRRLPARVLLAAVPAALLVAAVPSTAATTYCDPGYTLGPVSVSSLPKADRAAATRADVNRNGLVCGQRYYSARTGKLMGTHWEDDLLLSPW